MAFFDNLSKKASEASQKALQKTKEFSDVSRLNGLITDEEKSINNAYFQIGKLYASIHKNDPEAEFSGMISTVIEAEAKISEYKKQVQDIKGVQRCEKCGAEVPKGAAFCSACGTTMPKVEVAIPDDYIKCEGCGAVVKKSLRFCTSCGKPLNSSPYIVEAPIEGAEVISFQKKTCPTCGAELANDIIFCTECGTKL